MMKVSVGMFVGAVLAGCCCGTKEAGEVTVIPSRAVIVATKKAEQPAAEELARHLKLVTGTDVPVQAKAEPGAFVFSFDPRTLRDNAEACDWTVSPSNVVFSGNVAFAVVDFLENALGVRWPEGDFVSYEEQNPIRLTKLSGSWTPELKIRTIRGDWKRDGYGAFCRRMRAGSHDAPLYGHAFTKHWSKYGQKHPEYFAQRKDGLRGPISAKPEDLSGNVAVYAARVVNDLGMCCTSTGLVDQIVSDWKAAGAPKYINLCENDVPGQDSCHCPSCKALDVVPAKVNPRWETHYADRYVYFGNRVLAAARKVRPDVQVCYYAYNATQDAPARQRPDEASVIGIVPTIFTHDYIARYVESWRKTGARHFFYRPNRHHYFICSYLPIGSEEHFYEVFRYLKEQGSVGFDYDAPPTVAGGFEWFASYVLFHAMQDPSKPYSYWEDHYCQAFGEAKEDVKAYYRYWREEVWNKRLEPNLDTIVEKGKWFNFGRGLVQNLKDYYRTEDFDAAEKFLAAAEAKATSGSRREAVKRLRVAHDHARLLFEAIVRKSKANTEKLVAYRKLHGYPLYPWSEQYFGDVAGIKALLGPEKKPEKKVTVVPSKAVIVATKKDEKAAEDLARHLKLVTGVEIPVKAKAEQGSFAFSFETCKLRNNAEGCDWTVSPSGVVFRGKVAFAVVDFLENALGVRWPEGDLATCETQNPIRLTKLSGSWTPEVKIRTIRGQHGKDPYWAFCRHMRAGSHDAPKYGHAFCDYWKKYGKEHPEYFAMRPDGARGHMPRKTAASDDVAVLAANPNALLAVCCTSTGLVSQIVENWRKAGTNEYVNVCENDITGREVCRCPSCVALDVVPANADPRRPTYYADRYVFFANRVVEAARKVRPDAKVSYYAYNQSQDAPAKERPDEASVIGLVPTIFTHDYIARYVESWRKAGARHFFYRPNRHHYFRSPYLPTGSEEHFYEVCKYLKEQGSIGFDYDAPAAADGSFDWFGAYVLFHALQDPSKPYSYWEDHFCQAYGAAKEDVKAYYRYWREEVWNRRLEPDLDTIVEKGKCYNFGRGLVHNLKDYYRAADFDATEKFVAAAETKAVSASQREAVKRLRVAHDHARIFFEAVAHKSKANTEKLVAYRRQHGYPLYTWSEQYFGDVTGVEGLLGPKKKN